MIIPARLYQKLGIQWLIRHSHILKLGPEWMEKAEGMMPELHPPLRPQLPEVIPAEGEQRGRVAFTSLADLPLLIDDPYQRPSNQWWMRLRPINRVMAHQE